MSDVSSLRDTIIPKSDRINADTLMAGPETVVIAGVGRGDAETPVRVDLEGRLPWFPCKSMRRVLIAAWGDDGRTWAGRSLTLYTDPEVKFGGVKVGGIRISHMSDIDRDLAINLTATRGKRAPFTVRKLVVAAQVMYPVADFEKNLPAWRKAIADKKSTADSVITTVEKKGALTEAQKTAIKAPIEQPQEAAE